MGGAGPALRVVRAHPAVVARVLLAQAHREPHHARLGGYRSPVGLPGLRGGGRVALARHAGGARRGPLESRLAALPGDDTAPAGLLLFYLPAPPGDPPALSPGVAQRVARV